MCKLRVHLSPKELFSKGFATVISLIIHRFHQFSGVLDVLPFMRPLLRKRVAKNVKQKCLLQRGPSCFVAAGSQIGKMQYKVWPLRLLHCSGLVWVFSGEIPTHFSTFGRKQPRTTVWANYPFKYLHISLSGVFSITCGSLWRKAHLEETAGEIYPPPEPFSLTPQSRYVCV